MYRQETIVQWSALEFDNECAYRVNKGWTIEFRAPVANGNGIIQYAAIFSKEDGMKEVSANEVS